MIKFLRYSAILFFSLFLNFTHAQSSQNKILKKISEFVSIPQTLTYLHLNKSTYLQGEQIGFKAYVVNKADLKPDLETSNLYVQILDDKENVVVKKIMPIIDGTSFNSISIDSTLAAGEYTLKAYTNWQLNFKQHNFYAEKIRIIDTKSENVELSEGAMEIDAQFLPESGHTIENIINTIGVVIKDKNGIGLPNAGVKLLDKTGSLKAQTTLNDFGIGRLAFVPEIGENYEAHIDLNGKEFKIKVDLKVEKKGLVLSLIPLKDQVRLTVKTNDEALSLRKYTLAIHNNKTVKAIDVDLADSKAKSILIHQDELVSGINIFTLFDDNQNPIAERLYFKHIGIPQLNLIEASTEVLSDSTQIDLSFKDTENITSASVSILPKNSKASVYNNSILFQMLLRPYIKGSVQNASWYLEKTNSKKAQELDNLLLTQGWSSYDWQNIFNTSFNPQHEKTKGFVLRGIINDDDNNEKQFIIHPSNNYPPQIFKIPPGKDSFEIDDFFAIENEEISISEIKNRNRLIKPKLYLSLYPSQAPNLNADFAPSTLYKSEDIVKTNNTIYSNSEIANFLSESETLNEVELYTKKVSDHKKEERKLNNHSWGRVHLLTNEDRLTFATLADFLRSKGLIVNQAQGGLQVNAIAGGDPQASVNLGSDQDFSNGSRQSEDDDIDKQILFYLDGVPMLDSSMFANFSMATVKSVEINIGPNSAMGQGFLGSNGVIKITSDLTAEKFGTRPNGMQSYSLPIGYSKYKKYYIPKFQNETDDFFQAYGVIDWIPDLESGEKGDISFKIKNPKVDFQIILEGLSSSGKLIHVEKDFNLEN